jgi:hypothetical protein
MPLMRRAASAGMQIHTGALSQKRGGRAKSFGLKTHSFGEKDRKKKAGTADKRR